MSRRGKFIAETDEALRQRIVDLCRGESLERTAFGRKVLAHEMLRSAKHLGVHPWKDQTSAMTTLRNLLKRTTSVNQVSRMALEHALERFAGDLHQVEDLPPKEVTPTPGFRVTGVDTTLTGEFTRDTPGKESRVDIGAQALMSNKVVTLLTEIRDLLLNMQGLVRVELEDPEAVRIAQLSAETGQPAAAIKAVLDAMEARDAG